MTKYHFKNRKSIFLITWNYEWKKVRIARYKLAIAFCYCHMTVWVFCMMFNGATSSKRLTYQTRNNAKLCKFNVQYRNVFILDSQTHQHILV